MLHQSLQKYKSNRLFHERTAFAWQTFIWFGVTEGVCVCTVHLMGMCLVLDCVGTYNWTTLYVRVCVSCLNQCQQQLLIGKAAPSASSLWQFMRLTALWETRQSHIDLKTSQISRSVYGHILQMPWKTCSVYHKRSFNVRIDCYNTVQLCKASPPYLYTKERRRKTQSKLHLNI